MPIVDSRVGSDRNRFCAKGGHDRVTVRLLDGIKLPSTASVGLTPAWWRELNVRMDPTLRIDRRNS